jgi:hypothetical protein
MQGQINIAQAAGVDICDESEEEKDTADSQETEAEVSQTDTELELPTSGVWNLTCQHTWQPVLDDYGNPDWVVDIDWESRTFIGNIQAMSKEVDGIETLIWTWNETGSGTITDDGFFWGDFHNGSILSVQYGENEPIINDHGYDQKWIGAIEPDLSRICFYRVGAQEWFTLDWIRERGRQEMLKEGSGLCEAYCMGN